MNKGVFFEEIQDSHFLRKGGYFGTHICEFVGKGVNFDVHCFNVKMGFVLSEKSVFYRKKVGSFWTEKFVFYRENAVVLN